MQWLLGQSQDFRQRAAVSVFDSRLVLVALYALSLIPLALVYKRWAAEVSSAVIGITFLIHSYRTKDWHWLRSPFIRIAFALWAYLLFVVTPLAQEPVFSLMRSIVWGRHILLFAAIIFWLSQYGEEMKKVALWMAAILLVSALDGYWQYIYHASLLTGIEKPSNRLTGPLSKLVFGIFLAKLSFPVCGILLYQTWEGSRKRSMLACLLFLSLLLAGIALSNERTALITFLLGMGVAGALLLWKLKSARVMIVLYGILQVALLAALFFTQAQFQSRIHSSMEQAGGFTATVYAQLWKASWLVWQEHPLFGVGLMNFRNECLNLQVAGQVAYCDLHSHNIYLEWLSESGIIGFLGFVALVYYIVALIWQRARFASPKEFILIAFAFATLFPTFFPFAATQSFFSNWPALMAWMSVGMAVGMVQRIRHE